MAKFDIKPGIRNALNKEIHNVLNIPPYARSKLDITKTGELDLIPYTIGRYGLFHTFRIQLAGLQQRKDFGSGNGSIIRILLLTEISVKNAGQAFNNALSFHIKTPGFQIDTRFNSFRDHFDR